MKPSKFRNINDFLDFLPEAELEIVLYLRELVFECMPMAKEKLSYNVPYFKLNKNVCFIWPASVLWGNKPSYSGVRFGFTQGYLLKDELNYLDKGTRKQVYWRDFISLEEIDSIVLKSYLFEAIQIDSQSKKNT